MVTSKRILLFVAALASACPGREALGQTRTRADRTPLTYRDCGLYCNYVMTHGVEPETRGVQSRVKNMLPAHRAASADSTWTFYVMQYHAPKERRPEYDGSTIRDMVKNGKKVLMCLETGKPRILWGWHALNLEVRAWYRELEALVMNPRTLPDDQVGFRTPDRRLFDWAHGSPSRVDLTYALDDQERKRFTWRSYGRNMPVDPGEHALETPYDNPRVRLTLVLDEAASRLDQALAVRSIKGRPNRVPLVFRIDPRQPLDAMTVTAGVLAIKALGGSAHLAVSVDGANWSEPVHSDPSRKTSELTVGSPIAGEADRPLWVRIMLEGTAGIPGNVAAALKWIEVSAVFESRL